MNKTELSTAELLLDVGVSVAVRPLRFLGKRIIPFRRLTIRRPYMGGIIGINRYYAKIGVTPEEFKAYTDDQKLKFIAEHGQTVSLLVACTICRSWISYRTMRWLAAWWLRWRVHPDVLGELMLIILSQVNTAPFQITITSAEALNLMKPRLSH